MEEERFLFRLRRFFVELNLFQSYQRDERSLRLQRWSTRFYIPILFTAMSILLVYTVLQVYSKQIQITNPSLSTYLYFSDKYNNLNCPCTEIAVSYQNFMQLSASFHQVCSSDLIKDEWFSFLYDKNKTTLRYPGDFRATAFNQFQILRQLCQLSVTAIDDGIKTLYKSQLISGELLNENLFRAQVEADILAFQTITMSNFGRSLDFMRNFMTGNEVLTAVETAYVLIIDFGDRNNITYDDPASIPIPQLFTGYYTDIDGSQCGCDSNVSCYMSVGFYGFDTYIGSNYRGDFNLTKVSPLEFVDGWKVGCWPMESLLYSSLQTFYNQTEFNRILTNINSSVLPNRFTGLNRSISSNFSTTSILDILVGKLFVEEWYETLNYSSYYSQCQPQFCQYTVNQRSEPLYIITSLLGLYGGLFVVLRFIIPYLVKFLLERRSTSTVVRTNHDNIRWYSVQWIKNLCKSLLHLNLYRNPLLLEPNDIKHQIWSTRLYVGLLSLAIFILTLYSSIIVERRIIEIAKPSLDIVQELEDKQYSLTCPCQVLSINYEYLFQLTPNYHQICSSAFVTSEWIDYLNEIAGTSGYDYWNTDFNTVAPSMFQLLRSMCELSNRTVSNALFEFDKTELITKELLQRDFFSKQIDSTIEQFTSTLPNNLLSLLQLIRNITDMNQFMSGGYSNFAVAFHSDEQSSKLIATLTSDGFQFSLSNGTLTKCFCVNNFTCQNDTVLFKYGADGEFLYSYYALPHFYTGCYPIESLLPSTMECFYDNNPCFDIINNMDNIDNISAQLYENFSRLDPLKPSHFSIDVTMDQLLANLFVDSWSTTLFYPSYFNRCQPISCSYTIQQRKSLLEIVTTIAGLIGGLSKIFQLLSPYTISVFFYIIHRYRQRHQIRNNTTQQGDVRIQFEYFVHEKFLIIIGEHENIQTRIIGLFRNVRDILLKMNIFEDINNPSFDENQINIERQSTRLYFILLFLTTFILVIYTSLIYRSNEVKVEITTLPSLIHFQQLHNSTLISCPCTQLSSRRSAFYQMVPTFHQVCSSDFVKDPWLNSLYKSYNDTTKLPTNAFTFSGTAFAHFQSMLIMCNLARQAVIDARDLFLSTSVVSSQMLTEDLFYLSTNSTLEDFQSSLSNSFIHNLQMFRGLSQGNGFVSIYSTNWHLYLPDLSEDQTIYMKSHSYGECDCAISSSCIQNSTPVVTGYVVGCLPLESYLRSTMECLYFQSCLDQISSNTSLFPVPTPLNQAESRFIINTSNNDIVEEMFIESWSNDISYEKFFDECQPKSCSYIVTERYNWIYVLTTLLGLYGGITILLKLLIPFAMHQIYRCINRFRRRNRQVMPLN